MTSLPTRDASDVGGRSSAFGVFNLLAGKALRAPLWLLLSAMLARVLGPEGLGAWSMILAAGMLLNQLFLHWTQSITQRFGRVDWIELGTLKPILFARVPLLVMGWSLAVIVLFLNPANWLGRGFGLNGMEVPVLLALLVFWCMAEAQSLQQVRERFLVLAWAPISADLVLFLAVLVLVWTPMLGVGGLEGRLEILLCAMSAGWLFWLVWELRALVWHCQGNANRLRQLPTYMLFAAPLIPGFLVAYLAEWCDYFLIRYFYDESAVGLYHSAYQYLLILIGLPTALVSVLLPKAVQGFEQGGQSSLDALLREDGPRWAMLWFVIILLPLAVLPEVFILLVGEQFVVSKTVLVILLAVVPGAVVQHVCGIAYFVQGRLLVSTFAFFCIKFLVNFSISVILLPYLGVLGAAVGCVLSYLALQWLFVFYAQPGQRPSTSFVSVLGLAQVVGLVLCLVEGFWERLLIVAVVLLCCLLGIRRTSLLDAKLIRRVLPTFLLRYEKWFLYWLVRPSR